jgi:hypothetical protein
MIAIPPGDSQDAFEDPAMSNFSVAGWHLSAYEDPTGSLTPIVAVAQGPAVTYLQLTIKFNGTSSNVFVFDTIEFAPGIQSNTGNGNQAKWGPGWSYPATTWNPTRQELTGSGAVPVPGALVLGVIGLGLAGWVRKKFAL